MTLTLLWRPSYLAKNVNRHCLAPLVKANWRDDPASFHLWPLQVCVSPPCQTSHYLCAFRKHKSAHRRGKASRAEQPALPSSYQSPGDCTSSAQLSLSERRAAPPRQPDADLGRRAVRAPVSPRKPRLTIRFGRVFASRGARARGHALSPPPARGHTYVHTSNKNLEVQHTTPHHTRGGSPRSDGYKLGTVPNLFF